MNVADEFVRAALCFPDKKAMIFGNTAYTYAQMNRIIGSVEGYLMKMGVAKGDRIALYMANRPEWIMIYYAIARLGAITVCVPGAYKKNEVKGVVSDSRSSMVVGEALRCPTDSSTRRFIGTLQMTTEALTFSTNAP